MNLSRRQKRELKGLGIYYDYLKITEDKGRYILEQGIGVYFDDMDEYTVGLPKEVTVFKVREDWNFDWDEGKWLYSGRTGRRVG